MQARQLVKLPRIGCNMLLFEMFLYCIIASVIVKYICKIDWLTTIKLCVIMYVGWVLLCIILI